MYLFLKASLDLLGYRSTGYDKIKELFYFQQPFGVEMEYFLSVQIRDRDTFHKSNGIQAGFHGIVHRKHYPVSTHPHMSADKGWQIEITTGGDIEILFDIQADFLLDIRV